jgi:hypothetical protein
MLGRDYVNGKIAAFEGSKREGLCRHGTKSSMDLPSAKNVS